MVKLSTGWMVVVALADAVKWYANEDFELVRLGWWQGMGGESIGFWQVTRIIWNLTM